MKSPWHDPEPRLFEVTLALRESGQMPWSTMSPNWYKLVREGSADRVDCDGAGFSRGK